MSLYKSYKISLKDHAYTHGIDYQQWHGAGTPGDYSSLDVSQSDSFNRLVILSSLKTYPICTVYVHYGPT
jgi:hypothetical protein